VLLAILGVAESRRIREYVRFVTDPKLNSGASPSGVGAANANSNARNLEPKVTVDDLSAEELAVSVTQLMDILLKETHANMDGNLTLQDDIQSLAGDMRAMVADPLLHEQATLAAEQLDGNFQEQAKQLLVQAEELVVQMQTLMMDPDLQDEAKRLAQQVKKRMSADGKPRDHAKSFAKQEKAMEAILANPRLREQARRSVNHVEVMTANHNLQDQATRIAQQMETLMADLNFHKHGRRIAARFEAMMADLTSQMTYGGPALDSYSLAEVNRSSSGIAFVPPSVLAGKPVAAASRPVASQGLRSHIRLSDPRLQNRFNFPGPPSRLRTAFVHRRGRVAANSASPADRLPIGVIAVLSAAFLNLLGFTMAGPITPALATHFGLEVGSKFGSLTSAYPLGMLFGVFLWPQVSDRAGRKLIMAITLLGSAVGLSLQTYSICAGWSLQVFLAIRVLTGCFAGSSPISKAYLADLGSSKGRLPQYLALREAASTLAFILGPTLGGLFYEARRGAAGKGRTTMAAAAATTASGDATRSLAFVIGISAVASLAASALIALFVREDNSVVASSRTKADAANKDGAADYQQGGGGIESCPLGGQLWAGVASVCLVSFLFNVADSSFFAFFPALLKTSLGFDASSIGLAFSSFAFISLAVSTTLTSKSIGRFGPVATCVAGLTAIGTSLIGLAGASAMSSPVRVLVFVAAALYYFGVPLYGPTVPTMLLQCVQPHRRGAVMGLDGAVNTLARVVSPLVTGALYRSGGPSAAFSVAGGAALIAAIFATARRKSVKQGEDRQVTR